MIHIFQHFNNETRRLNIGELETFVRNKEGYFWIDMEDSSMEEKKFILVSLLNIPNDIFTQIQKGSSMSTTLPMLEEYSDFLFLNFNTIDLLDQHSAKIDPLYFKFITSELNAVVCKNIVVTYHRDPINYITFLRQECLLKTNMLERGSNYLLSLIIDKIINSYLPCIARMDALIEIFEKEIYHSRENKSIEIILHFKSKVVQVRRIAYYEKEMLYRLSRTEMSLLSQTDQLYFSKELENLNRLTKMLDSYRDAVSGLLDAYMSFSSQNMNEVMKMLTIMSTIFLPLSVITGFYGMNLNFLPWSNEHNSYIPVTLFMALVAGTMLIVFKRKKWL